MCKWENVEGVYKSYSKEYLRWNIFALCAKVSIRMTQEEAKEWYIDTFGWSKQCERL